MTKEQLERLLNIACEIITSLEGYAMEHPHYPEHNKELEECIDSFFSEIKYSDSIDADMEAQDWEVFGDDKI